LAGPTASGKTAAALALAREHTVEIISVDSALVYRGMDIGTAKPTPQELAAVPHHLINIRDPLMPYSAANFVADAQALMQDITARGRLPLLVGGTMLYFKALLDGIDEMPKADAAIRAGIEEEARQQGWPAMHALLAEVDPVTAARLNPADAQRVQRALEVYRASGQTMASFHTLKKIATEAINTPASGQLDSKSPEKPPQSVLLISLEPNQRSWLHERIAQRFDAMLATGFLDEVRALRARGDLNPDLPAMRCVGYRQAWTYLDALEVHAAGYAGKPPAVTELRDQGIFATRQLAKRQLTWLRSMPERQVVACDEPDALEQVLAKARDFLQTQPTAQP
ncbi:MAG: tRNA (adenosine(37)-N6)-dimethylallyltransferase MiaA, partial [Rhodoferax sp.]|nr:tRNA (adenosine(37)-N6)-dimethylallyltransferase MiaA [Rhodoferax sp.]